jgi:hypothetical protein
MRPQVCEGKTLVRNVLECVFFFFKKKEEKEEMEEEKKAL